VHKMRTVQVESGDFIAIALVGSALPEPPLAVIVIPVTEILRAILSVLR
jgi:hypothetical protein